MFVARHLQSIVEQLNKLEAEVCNSSIIVVFNESVKAPLQTIEDDAITERTALEDVLGVTAAEELNFGQGEPYLIRQAKDRIAEKLLKNFQTQTAPIARKIYNDYIDSIQLGEYYSLEASDHLRKISKILARLITTTDELIQFFTNYVKVEVIKQLKNEFESFQSYTYDYVYLCDRVVHRLEKSTKLIKNTFLEDKVRFMSDSLEQTVKDPKNRSSLKYFFFLLNIKLAEIDEGHLSSPQSVEQLLEYATKLFALKEESLIPENHYVEIAKEKCNFLIMKILRRFNKENDKSYVLHASGQKLNFNVFDSSNSFTYFKTFDSKSDSIYTRMGATFSSSNISTRRHVIKYLHEFTKNPSSLNAEKLHFITKFCKRNAQEIEKGEVPLDGLGSIQTILWEVLQYYQTNRNTERFLTQKSFNYFYFESSWNLTANAYLQVCLSSILQQKLTSNDSGFQFRRALEIFERIVIQEEESAPCFQVYRTFYTFLGKLNEQIRTELLPIATKEVVDEINVLVKLILEKYYWASNKFIEKVKYSEENRLLPIYLTEQECFVTVKTSDNTERTVFLDSGYILPPDYSTLLKRNEQDKITITDQEALMFHDIQTRHLDCQKKSIEDDVKSKIKDYQYNIITVIGLYAGFITFILSSVSVVPKLERSYVAIMMLLFVLSTSLLLFVLVIRLVFKSEKEVFSIADLVQLPNKISCKLLESNLNIFRWKIHIYFLFVLLFIILFLLLMFGVRNFSDQRIPVLNSTDRVEYRKVLPDGKEVIDSSRSSRIIHTSKDSSQLEIIAH